MASFRLIRNIRTIKSRCELCIPVHSVPDTTCSELLSPGQRNLSIQLRARSTPTQFRNLPVHTVTIPHRCAWTKPSRNRSADSAELASRSGSGEVRPSSAESSSPYTVVNAAKDEEYFKEIGRKAYSSVGRTGTDWNKFVDPDKPAENDNLRNQSPEDKFGPRSFPTDRESQRNYPKRSSSVKPVSRPMDDVARQQEQELEEIPPPGTARKSSETFLNYPKKAVSARSISEMVEDELVDDVDWKAVEKTDPENRPFETVPETDAALLEEVGPAKQPFSHNLAAYANDNENVKKFVDMGVQVWQLDKDPEMSQRMMTADWNSRIQPWVDWMQSLGLNSEGLSRVMATHPRIFTVSIRDLDIVVEYFTSKRVTKEAIGEILIRAPQTFSWNPRYIDKRLGEIQKMFRLTGSEMRDVIATQPKLIVLPAHQWNVVRLFLLGDLQFSKDDVKQLLLNKPKLFRKEKAIIQKNYEYLIKVCHFTQEQILQYPDAMMVRTIRMKERHLFLKQTRKNQYDPTKPAYVSVKAMAGGRDTDFCRDVAKVPVEVYNEFCKTL